MKTPTAEDLRYLFVNPENYVKSALYEFKDTYRFASESGQLAAQHLLRDLTQQFEIFNAQIDPQCLEQQYKQFITDISLIVDATIKNLQNDVDRWQLSVLKKICVGLICCILIGFWYLYKHLSDSKARKIDMQVFAVHKDLIKIQVYANTNATLNMLNGKYPGFFRELTWEKCKEICHIGTFTKELLQLK